MKSIRRIVSLTTALGLAGLVVSLTPTTGWSAVVIKGASIDDLQEIARQDPEKQGPMMDGSAPSKKDVDVVVIDNRNYVLSDDGQGKIDTANKHNKPATTGVTNAPASVLNNTAQNTAAEEKSSGFSWKGILITALTGAAIGALVGWAFGAPGIGALIGAVVVTVGAYLWKKFFG